MWQARVSLRRMLWRLLLALGFVVLGVWIAMAGGAVERLSGGVIVLMFGGFAAVMLAVLRRRGSVAIEVSPKGLWWRQWSDHPIAWADVQRAEVRRQHRQRYLCLWLDTPARWRSPATAKGVALSKRMGFGDVALHALGTDRTFDDLVDAVATYIIVER